MRCHGISRKREHISVIICISAVGISLTPYILTSQDSASVREQLKKHRVRSETALIVKPNTKPYINAEILFDYIRPVLVPNLAGLPGLNEVAEEMAMPLIAQVILSMTCSVFSPRYECGS
jgi:hypothetical protein